jgi:phosphatidate cytidylyltransferase
VSELARRVAVAIVAIPAAIGLIYAGDAALAALLGILAALAAWEFFRLAGLAGTRPLGLIGIPLAGLVPIAVHGAYLGVFQITASGVAVGVLAVMAAAIWTHGVSGHPMGAVGVTVLGVAYTGGMLSFAYAIRYLAYVPDRGAGTALLLLPLLLTWASDTGAYAVGRLVGKRKLIPSVSPGKTWEGAIGGVLLPVAIVGPYLKWVLRPLAHIGMTPAAAIAFAVAVSITAQVGDLFESLLKREAGAKDSSHLIPGHGGVLDRLDSLFFVLPVSALLLGPLLRYAP